MPFKRLSCLCTTEQDCPYIFKGHQGALCQNSVGYSCCTLISCFLIYLWLSSMTINSCTYSFISWRLLAWHHDWPWLCSLILSLLLGCNWTLSLELTPCILLILVFLHPALKLEHYRHTQQYHSRKENNRGFNGKSYTSFSEKQK